MVKLCLFGLLLSLFTMCKTPMFNPAAYAGSYILVGEGGGFTGREKGTCINDKGLVYGFEGLGEWSFTFQKKVAADQFKQLQSNFTVLKLNELDLQEPGNMYKFIEWSDGQQKKRLTWNDQMALNTKATKLFFDIFQKITSK